MCGGCFQEEMARLQQNIEDLKMASGDDTEEDKVASCPRDSPLRLNVQLPNSCHYLMPF